MNEQFPDGEARIAHALRWFRESLGMTRAEFSATLEIGRERWASYEDARAPLRWEVYCRLATAYGINPRWLAVGETHLFAPFDESLLSLDIAPRALFLSTFHEHLSKSVPSGFVNSAIPDEALRRALAGAVEALGKWAGGPGDEMERAALAQWFWIAALRLFAQARFAVQAAQDYQGENKRGIIPKSGKTFPTIAKKNDKSALTTSATAEYIAPMPKQIPELKALLSRVRELTSPAGKKTELAAFLDVKLSQLSEWLSESETTRKPSGEYTLQLLRWVSQQEHK